MKIAVDCEFNGFGGELISMALVSEDGREWYEVLSLPDEIDPWVETNVIPKLNKQPSDFLDLPFFKASFQEFVGGFDKPTIVADWYTDLVHFFSLFAGEHHGESFHKPLNVELLADVSDFSPEVPHNALSDAKAILKAVL